MNLSKLSKISGNKTKRDRIGRGYGSGSGGHTVGRGSKGQKSRTGNTPWAGFEGGQVPLYKRMPKLGGFKNPHKKNIISISLFRFNAFDDGAQITPKSLIEAGMLKSLPTKAKVKILSNGELNKKLQFKGFLYSSFTKEKIEKSGSTIVA